MYNLSEATGGYINLSSAIAVAPAGAMLFTTTGVGPVAFNGIIKALTAIAGQQGTFLPSGASSTYQQQIRPVNLGPNQKCMFVWMVDYTAGASAPYVYVAQGAVVDATQPAPPPALQGAVDAVQSTGAAAVDSGTFAPQFTTGLTPIAAFTVKTDSVDGLQMPAAWGSLTAAPIAGVTFQTAWNGTGITTVVYQLFNWPANSLV